VKHNLQLIKAGLLILQYCIGIGNTIMNIGSSFLLMPIVNTFMKQNGRIYIILVLLELHRSLRQSTKTSWFGDVCCLDVLFLPIVANLLNIWEFVYFVCGLSPPKRRVVYDGEILHTDAWRPCAGHVLGFMSI